MLTGTCKATSNAGRLSFRKPVTSDESGFLCACGTEQAAGSQLSVLLSDLCEHFSSICLVAECEVALAFMAACPPQSEVTV